MAVEAPAGGAADDAMAPLDLDAIPSLSLPPPIIPTRTMGHQFLENQVHVQLKLGIAGRIPAVRFLCVGVRLASSSRTPPPLP